MAWKLKRTIFGLDFDVDVETKPFVIDELYSLKLRKLWTGLEFADRKKSKEFITQALSWLPHGFFIIFFFDGTEEYFVQFCNWGGNIFMDFPMWKGSNTFGKEQEFIKVLRSLNLKRKYSSTSDNGHDANVYYLSNKTKSKREITAEFGENYSLAADATLLIAGHLYGTVATGLFYYRSDRLILEE